MKHSFVITIYLLILFVCSQLVGVAVLSSYQDKAIEVGGMVVEPPPVEEDTSFVFIFIAIMVGTALVLGIMKLGLVRLWKLWYFAALLLTISIALAGLFKLFGISSWIAVGCALLLAGSRILYPNIYSQNLSELFIYSGLAAIFVPVLNLHSVLALLVLISIYDMYAVWKSKHMVAMAQFQTKSNVFAGLYLPYTSEGVVKKLPKRKVSTKTQSVPKKVTSKSTPSKHSGIASAILGGGDIGFPLFFIGVVLNTYGLGYALGIIPFVTGALALLLFYSENGKFYPAMPFISAGCLVGLRVLSLFF